MKIVYEKLGFLRFYTWWNYKLPPLFGIAFLFTLICDVPLKDAVIRFLIFIPCMIGAAGFGHYLNDLFDIEDDRRAGKPNSAGTHSPTKRSAIIFSLLFLALVPWLIFYKTGLLHILVVIVLLLFVLYSVPPFRFKNRGILGVLADTLYAHAIPAVIISLAVLGGVPVDEQYRQLVIIVFIWQFFVGFRNIVHHQIEDFEQDNLTQTRTWALQLGMEPTRKICLFVIHPLEIISYAFVVMIIFNHSILCGALLLLLIVWRLLIYLFIYEKGYLKSLRNYFAFVNNSNEEDFPLVLLLCLSAANPWFIIVFILYNILFPEYFLRMMKL